VAAIFQFPRLQLAENMPLYNSRTVNGSFLMEMAFQLVATEFGKEQKEFSCLSVIAKKEK